MPSVPVSAICSRGAFSLNGASLLPHDKECSHVRDATMSGPAARACAPRHESTRPRIVFRLREYVHLLFLIAAVRMRFRMVFAAGMGVVVMTHDCARTLHPSNGAPLDQGTRNSWSKAKPSLSARLRLLGATGYLARTVTPNASVTFAYHVHGSLVDVSAEKGHRMWMLPNPLNQ
ncbi:hypothetical protein FKP32DRAFT_240294 [Trametes sanguinea]|nr:hypothetical protein FKP32DRAFT_240294 [Trametes sanguinea]